MLQLSGKRTSGERASLRDLRRGEYATLECLDLPLEEARRLMELGFLPGSRVTAGMSAPGGNPRVFQVDGAEVALRLDVAAHLLVQAVRAVE